MIIVNFFWLKINRSDCLARLSAVPPDRSVHSCLHCGPDVASYTTKASHLVRGTRQLANTTSHTLSLARTSHRKPFSSPDPAPPAQSNDLYRPFSLSAYRDRPLLHSVLFLYPIPLLAPADAPFWLGETPGSRSGDPERG
jgi:hypothetical protein